TSAVPLKRVELRRGAEVLLNVDLTGLAKNADGLYEVRRTESVRLTPGTNVLEVLAVNEGGERAADRVITYVETPAWLEDVRLESQDRPGEFLEPEANGSHRFPPAAGARLWLRGRVAWLDDNDRQLADPKLRLRVWVNGAPQAQA